VKSDSAIAEEIGVSDFTVRKARKRTASDLAVEKRTGKDDFSCTTTLQTLYSTR
jgi:hypothetical protein